MTDDFPDSTLQECLERAELLYDLGQLPDAMQEVDHALQLDSFSADAHAMKAVIALADGNGDDALTSAGTALELYPLHVRATVTRGYALAALRRSDEAMQAATNILDQDHGSWVYHVHYALITRQAKNGQHTMDAAWNAVNLAPDEPKTHLTLAVVAADLGLDDLSKRALNAAQRLDPEAITKVEDLAEGRTITASGATSRDGGGHSTDDVSESSAGRRLGKGVARFYGNTADDAQTSASSSSRPSPGRRGFLSPALLPSVLMGITVFFGAAFLFAFVGPDELSGGRIFMGLMACATFIGWYFSRQPDSSNE